eukprot:5991732-Pleurochrysis_carterae.AAC.1
MDLSDATQEREAYDQWSTGSTGNTRGKRVPATVSVRGIIGTHPRLSLGGSLLAAGIPSNRDRSRRLRSSSSNSASRHA